MSFKSEAKELLHLGVWTLGLLLVMIPVFSLVALIIVFVGALLGYPAYLYG
jgi:hypothetical protein|tara:strand:+ start:279 stop:431 length:153 start_codon:yes stop_codon:yes gene_type:complete